MAILNYKLPRKHKSLAGFSKAELDKAESYLNANRFRLTPFITWLSRGFIIILWLLSEIRFFEKQLGQKIFYSEEIDFLIAAVIVYGTFYVGEKTREKHLLKLALAYLKTTKKMHDSASP
jgi:hypothetical protein